MVKIEENPGQSGFKRFTFKLSMEDRSRYANDIVRCAEWKRLMEDFDHQWLGIYWILACF